MKKEQLVINTLVFLEQLNNGTLQEELLEPIYQLGIQTVEIRREFIHDLELELVKIREQAEKYNMSLFYSIPGELYQSEELLYADLKEYFAEAVTMGAKQIKLGIGDYGKVKEEDVVRVNQLCEEHKVGLTIENDQTVFNGKSDKVYRFLNEFRSMGGKISATFDTGNWLWQNEEPLDNAKLLKSFVAYIHLKDVKGGTKPHTTLLDDGDIKWREVLAELPQVPVALEYPCGTNTTQQLFIEMKKLVNA